MRLACPPWFLGFQSFYAEFHGPIPDAPNDSLPFLPAQDSKLHGDRRLPHGFNRRLMTDGWSDHTLQSDLLLVSQPDTTKPFSSKKDVLERLLPYHVFADTDQKSQDQMVALQEIKKISEPIERARKRAKTALEASSGLGESNIEFRNACERCFLESSVIQQERASLSRLYWHPFLPRQNRLWGHEILQSPTSKQQRLGQNPCCKQNEKW